MTTFYVVSEKRTPSDSFDTTYFINLEVEAETRRKAQNLARKIDPRISFSGIRGDLLLEAHEIKKQPWIERNGAHV